MGGREFFLVVGEVTGARAITGLLGDAGVVVVPTTHEASEIVSWRRDLLGLIVELEPDSDDLDQRMELLRDARWRHPRLPTLVVAEGSQPDLQLSTRSLGARYSARADLKMAIPAFQQWCLREEARHTASSAQAETEEQLEGRSSGVYARGSVLAEVKKRANGG